MKLLQHFKELTVRPKNAKELKGLILQLAIQGKLTANWRKENSDVEPASELLSRIQKKKEQLVKEKKIRKEKSLRRISKDEIPNELPIGWLWCRVGDLTTIKGGKRIPKGYQLTDDKTDHVYIRVTDMKNGTVIFNKLKYITDNVFEIIKAYTISKDDLYITIAGTIGDVGEIPKELDNMNLTENAAKLILYQTDKMYMKTLLSSHICQSQFLSKVNQMAQPKLALHRVASTIIPLPPLEEQKEIVKVVETLFKEVEQLEQLTIERIGLKEDFVTSALNQLTTNNANQEWTFLQDHFKSFFNETTNIKKLRETVLQLAVQGKLTADWRTNNPDTEDASVLLKRIQKEKSQLVKDKKIKDEKRISSITEEEIPYGLPEKWLWCRMQDLCPNISSGSTPPKPYFKDEGVPYLKVYNIRNQKIDFEYRKQFVDSEYHSTKLKRSILKPGDVIMNIVGPPLGKVAIIPNDFPEWNCNQAISFFKPLDRRLNTWIYTFLLAGTFLDRIELIGTAGQDNISVTKSKTIMLPLPPLEEQKAIVKKVNALMGLCDALEQEVQQSQEYSEMLMQSCLREVFEGESKTIEV
ncbi:type I restriction-modification system specificity subunit S [Algibacter lectus]|uniref:Type I restriction-modification system specificity subunit S n=1 Tax=Algibacter lectus TaxID=221126 RepID=A0A090WSE9_9FLAO|nr:restriction endonuclease subunit S [Algibacter lectus]GAL80010.1 type I restriction-modification system specificity subunit S [Algibacter lectus]